VTVATGIPPIVFGVVDVVGVAGVIDADGAGMGDDGGRVLALPGLAVPAGVAAALSGPEEGLAEETAPLPADALGVPLFGALGRTGVFPTGRVSSGLDEGNAGLKD
jgi:hypothetical protein